jgi:uncharacterized protein (TIGR03435 family)
MERIALAKGVTEDETEYDVEAKAEGDGVPTRSEFRQMLRALLGERFQLRVRREFREVPVYALTIVSGGPRFSVSSPEEEKRGNHGVHGINLTLDLVHATMDDICREMGGYFWIDKPVVDRTGLTGAYDIRFEATPENRVGKNLGEEEVSIFVAVREQLGLKLEPAKAPMEFVVIEQFSRPSGN